MRSKNLYVLLFLSCLLSTPPASAALRERFDDGFSTLPEDVIAEMQMLRLVAGIPVSRYLVSLHQDGTVTAWNVIESVPHQAPGAEEFFARQIKTVTKIFPEDLSKLTQIIKISLGENLVTVRDDGDNKNLRISHKVKEVGAGKGYMIGLLNEGKWYTLRDDAGMPIIQFLNDQFHRFRTAQ